MDKKLEMELINSEELNHIKGGAIGVSYSSMPMISSVSFGASYKPGDTIFKACAIVKDVVIKMCATYEVTCPSTFTFDQDKGSECSSAFVVKKL